MKLKRVIAVVLSAAMVFAVAACGQKPATDGGQSGSKDPAGDGDAAGDSGKVIEVTLPHYKTGENVGAAYFEPMIERFNAKYEGKYHVTIEEVTQDVYPEKLKQLGQQGKLPFFIEGGDTTWIQDVVIPGDMFYDLSEFVESHPEIKELISEEAMAYNTTEDGKIVTLMTPIMSPISMFYNESLYKPSKDFAEMTWDDVAAELGDADIAFMTGENAWSTMLVLSSLIAVEPGGPELLQNGIAEKITDFNQEPIINAFAKLQKLMQNNSTPSAVGATFADAANTFFSNNSAIIANGSWMVPDFDESASDKWSNNFDPANVHGAILPGNVALANSVGYCFWIPATNSEEQIEVGLALLEFMFTPEELEAWMLSLGGLIPGFEYSEEFLAKRAENRIMDEYMAGVTDETIIVPAFADAIPSSLAQTEFGKLLPKLVDGSFTPEQFCEELTKKAAETALE